MIIIAFTAGFGLGWLIGRWWMALQQEYPNIEEEEF